MQEGRYAGRRAENGQANELSANTGRQRQRDPSTELINREDRVGQDDRWAKRTWLGESTDNLKTEDGREHRRAQRTYDNYIEERKR